MKRGVAFLLVITLTMGLLTGCKNEKNEKMLVSEWLYLINATFGFEGYSHTEPYIDSITQNNPYFDDIQIAFEYEVIPEGYSSLNLEEELTREFCALTLSGAIYLSDTAEVTIADSEDITYKEAVTTVLNKGIMFLDDNGKFNPDDTVPYDEAVAYVNSAYYAWVNHEFTPTIEYDLKENVVDFSGVSAVKKNDSGRFYTDSTYIEEQKKWLKANNFSYDESTGTITLDNISEKGIEEGSVITLPESLEHPEGLFLKVTGITENADGSFLVSTTSAEFEDVFGENYLYQDSFSVNFSDCVIYDTEGNVLSKGKFGESVTASNMSHSVDNMIFDGKQKIKIPIADGIEAEVEASGNELSISVSGETYSKKGKSNPGKNGKLEKEESELTITKTFSNFKIDNAIPNPFNYKNSYLKLGMKFDTDEKITYKSSNKTTVSYGQNFEKLYGEAKGNYRKISKAVKQLSNGNYTSASKELCKIKVVSGFGVSIDLSLQVRITAEGEIELSVGYDGVGMGIEKRKKTTNITTYYNGGRRNNLSIAGAAKVEVTAGINLAAKLLNINVADAEFAVGGGATAETKLNFINSSRNPVYSSPVSNDELLAAKQLIQYKNAAITSSPAVNGLTSDNEEFTDILLCVDLKIYPIVRITVGTSSSILGKFVSWSKDIVGEENAIANLHIECGENGYKVTECTLTEKMNNDGVERGDSLEVDPLNDIALNVGETYELELTEIPETKKKSYTLDDINVESRDEKIAKANGVFKHGDRINDHQPQKIVITALSPGDTTVVVRTCDSLFTKEINVHVNTAEESANPYLQFKSYSASVAEGSQLKLTITNLPGGKNENGIFWSVEDSSVASVDPITGVITGVSEGVTIVRAYIPGNEEFASYCMISVTDGYTSTDVSGVGSSSEQWLMIKGLPPIIIDEI